MPMLGRHHGMHALKAVILLPAILNMATADLRQLAGFCKHANVCSA